MHSHLSKRGSVSGKREMTEDYRLHITYVNIKAFSTGNSSYLRQLHEDLIQAASVYCTAITKLAQTKINALVER